MAKEALAQDLADFLVTKNFDPEYFDEQGQPAEAGDARTIKFDYQSQSGKNYGTAVVVLADDELSFFFGDNLGRGMEPDDKSEWYEFLEQLSDQAASHSVTWTPSDINRLKHTLSGIAAIKEGLFEGYYGTRRVSYMGEATDARLVIRHNRTLGETDKRYRYIESLFIETADQERFRLPFRSLSGGRAMLEHVRSGGRPYDVRGCHIAEIVSEMAVLGRFHRAQQHRIYEGVTQELVESAVTYYRGLQETLRHLGTGRGYKAYFESWTPDAVGAVESLVEDLRTLFVEQSVDARIEAALPTLAKIQQQGIKMKEAQIFEAWANRLAEGTWALPDTPEAQEKLNQLMSRELIVGPDATNATEQLYDVIGDDELFDILSDLADRDPRANCWDDSDVQRRLAELGIQTPQSTRTEPADVDQDEAPAVKEDQLDEIGDTPAGKDALRAVQNRAYDTMDAWSKNSASGFSATPKQVKKATGAATAAGNRLHGFGPDRMKQDTVMARDALRKQLSVAEGGEKDRQWSNKDMERLRVATRDFDDILSADGPEAIKQNLIKKRIQTKPMAGPKGVLPEQGMAEGDNRATFVEDRELAEMLKYAGVPIREGVLTDSTGSTLEHIKDTFQRDVKDFTQSGEMSDALYDVLYDYYFDDMPYGTKKARTGDPYEWISDRFAEDLGINENLISPMIMPVSEGSCNMTMEGEYCPEHGLMECGSMEEDGGAVGMPYSMGENNEIVQNAKKLTDGWKGTLAGSAAGGLAGSAAGEALGPAAGAALGGAVGGLPGALAGAASGAAAGGAIGGAAGGLAGGKIGDKLGGPEETDEGSGTANMIKGAAKAATQGLADMSGSGKEIAKNLVYMEDDPINSNSAMTGSYYEGKETRTQEGDALLARIKSLALLR